MGWEKGERELSREMEEIPRGWEEEERPGGGWEVGEALVCDGDDWRVIVDEDGSEDR